MIMALNPMRALIVFSFCFRGPSLSHMCSVMVLQCSDRTICCAAVNLELSLRLYVTHVCVSILSGSTPSRDR